MKRVTTSSTNTPTVICEPGVITLPRADHRLVNMLFKRYEQAISPIKKKVLAEQICMELIIYTKIVDKINYPIISSSGELIVYETPGELITNIQNSEPDDELYDARITALSEFVRHCERQEQSEAYFEIKAPILGLVQPLF